MTVQENKGRVTVAEQVHGSVARLVALLATMEPVDDDFPDGDEGLQPIGQTAARLGTLLATFQTVADDADVDSDDPPPPDVDPFA